MAIEIRVPDLGESVTEAKIASIIKESGSFVKENEELIELETEKVNQVLYAQTAGIVSWKVNLGDDVKIGQMLGSIEPKAEERKEIVKEKAEPKPPVEKIVEKKAPAVSALGLKRKKMSRIRQTIASRLVESLRESAMLTTFNEVDMSAINDLRTAQKEKFAAQFGVKLGLMSFFVKAVVEALQACPDLNSYIEGDEIVTFESYDIGIAVGGARGGLVVPVLRGADKLSFSEIEKNIVDLATKAREGKLTVDEISGGSFTITNGGVYGSLLSTPILNPPQSGILGMHKIEKRAVVVDDQIVIRPMMYLALSYDHRIVDGKEAVTFLVRVKELLEHPSMLGPLSKEGV